MTDLVEFLLARFNEDWQSWAVVADRDVVMMLNGEPIAPRMLAEVHAKRRIVDECMATMRYPGDIHDDTGQGLADETLRLLALPYADHPDYDESWRPTGSDPR